MKEIQNYSRNPEGSSLAETLASLNNDSSAYVRITFDTNAIGVVKDKFTYFRDKLKKLKLDLKYILPSVVIAESFGGILDLDLIERRGSKNLGTFYRSLHDEGVLEVFEDRKFFSALTEAMPHITGLCKNKHRVLAQERLTKFAEKLGVQEVPAIDDFSDKLVLSAWHDREMLRSLCEGEKLKEELSEHFKSKHKKSKAKSMAEAVIAIICPEDSGERMIASFVRYLSERGTKELTRMAPENEEEQRVKTLASKFKERGMRHLRLASNDVYIVVTDDGKRRNDGAFEMILEAKLRYEPGHVFCLPYREFLKQVDDMDKARPVDLNFTQAYRLRHGRNPGDNFRGGG